MITTASQVDRPAVPPLAGPLQRRILV